MPARGATSIACPKCDAPLAAQLADAVNAAHRPDLRDEILARQLHRLACTGCDAALELEHRLVYTDLVRRHWLYVGADRDRTAWPALEARLARDLELALSRHSPLIHGLADGLRSRVVFGYEELREKLVIWDAGADDALLECLKVRAVAGDPELAAPGSRLIVDRIAPDDAIDLLWFAPGAAAPSAALTAAPSWLADTDRDRASLAMRFPELFRGGYVNFRRMVDR
jgi:hypothetical protein